MSLPETGECIATTPESGRCSVLNFEIRDILCPFLKPMMYCIAPFHETGGCTVPHSEIWDICASSRNLWHVISRFIHVIKLWAINNSYNAFLACFVLSEIDNSNRSDIRFGYLFTAPPLKTWVSIACGLGGGGMYPLLGSLEAPSGTQGDYYVSCERQGYIIPPFGLGVCFISPPGIWGGHIKSCPSLDYM